MQRNFEIGARFAAALETGTVPDDLLASDFTIENVEMPVVEGTYHGREGLERWRYDFIELLEPGEVRYAAEQTDATPDAVVAKIRLFGRGRASGAPLDLTHWGVIWIVDGKVARAVGYRTRRDALAAVGL